MTQLLPRFKRVSAPRLQTRKGTGACSSGKVSYQSESEALTGLVRVRKDRVANPDGLAPESGIYLCQMCDRWHLTSGELRADSVTSERERGESETWEKYAARLERRIAEQRSQILSLHTLGHGAMNRQTRKRISALTMALGHMTERWETERAHRIELVRKLNEKRPRRRWGAR